MSTLARLAAFVLAAALVGSPVAAAAVEPGEWSWPLVGPVIRAFDPPDSPYGAGHRGIDIAAPVGSTIVSPAPGVVTFAGRVGGHLFITIDHDRGWESTYSWISERLVSKGNAVTLGGVIARSGWGHPGAEIPHLHFGVKLDDQYVDPLSVLAPAGVVGLIHLAQLRSV
jgi:murein DD-endopeptidase MepM/ murein hydrolase activator NlpD